MRNENLLTMKQPELGKKILELRKQKGLTQEELVEKCNINVRTIQRIEAGETTPRSFTIKTILQALDADINSFKKETELTSQDRKVLNLAWVFGIVYFVFGFIETIADIYQFTEDTSTSNKVVYTAVKVISSAAFVVFFTGFLRIAKMYTYKLLEIVVYVMMIAYVVSEIHDIFLINSSNETIVIIGIVEFIVFGAIQIIFGLSLLRLKDKLGSFIQVNAIMEIITGVCLATIVLASLGAVFLIPTTIIEIIVLYKLAKK
ncbi:MULTISPECIES: helix-turn-helix domain-containing protein [unclassified Tenacibaculum]|uniref:helix-turn-helix domain-containing protein n=1 Tax=unclassified Tenacibaculum TaxID=2635139 RepID=UPI001F237FC1|nr:MULTISPECIES: helix-turn-helix transcriptional regulator [unclassified Tenacibaculum]MCF2874179.1 helix-turn-helix domain-containing protein [Tenacibaculum sp. Cn5-1]MCF2934760.1 helix-turn-helix domain-containing protein [Tenacibaculum sp. Cn5-34]MCG7510970.1 helix-turn-helix domain-containing protein [Tenacibaculum sp. Cn5-46]